MDIEYTTLHLPLLLVLYTCIICWRRLPLPVTFNVINSPIRQFPYMYTSLASVAGKHLPIDPQHWITYIHKVLAVITLIRSWASWRYGNF